MYRYVPGQNPTITRYFLGGSPTINIYFLGGSPTITLYLYCGSPKITKQLLDLNHKINIYLIGGNPQNKYILALWADQKNCIPVIAYYFLRHAPPLLFICYIGDPQQLCFQYVGAQKYIYIAWWEAHNTQIFGNKESLHNQIFGRQNANNIKIFDIQIVSRLEPNNRNVFDK